MHDLIAELTGYRNELASAQRNGKDDRAAAVSQEIDRVYGEISKHVERLLDDAAGHDAAGQDIRAGQFRAAARRFAAALTDEQRPAAARALFPAAAGAEDAAAAGRQERAVPRRSRREN